MSERYPVDIGHSCEGGRTCTLPNIYCSYPKCERGGEGKATVGNERKEIVSKIVAYGRTFAGKVVSVHLGKMSAMAEAASMISTERRLGEPGKKVIGLVPVAELEAANAEIARLNQLLVTAELQMGTR